jgi:hypothetical protein
VIKRAGQGLKESLGLPSSARSPRWFTASLRREVENDFRDLKATLGLDVLRTRTQEMIAREVLMQAIAYNLVCAILQDSARKHGVPLDRLSFKGTLAALRHWAPLLMKSTTCLSPSPGSTTSA